MRTLPLLPPARPAHLAVHPHKPVLMVACHGTDGIWEIRCVHAVTGKFSSTTETSPLINMDVCHHKDAHGLLVGVGPGSPLLTPTCCPALFCPALPADLPVTMLLPKQWKLQMCCTCHTEWFIEQASTERYRLIVYLYILSTNYMQV